ncbi:MAG TPA: TonB-dependent receptor [Pyrinomonadaceae bacterium]|nr:TonB-dependent receptor [Pyrinomonadaceae bacterium]
MNRIVSIPFLLIFLSLFAFGQADTTAGSITGIVRLGSENTVLHEATIQIVELKKTAITDDSGAYRFTGIAPGTYTLVVHQEGFADQKKTVTVTAATEAKADFALMLSGLKENVTVTASGSEQSTFEAIESVATVDSTQLTLRASVGLGEVLESESGVSKRSGGPGASRPVIRGFDGDRVMVSSDGVSVGSLASQSGDHSEPLDTASIERIEVVKGPATLLYGSSAIGGVVNAISGHDEGAHPGLRGFFSGIGGSNNNQAAANGGIEYGKNNWMIWGNAGKQRTGDYKAGGDFGTVRNSFARNTTGGLGGGYYAKKAFFNANYSYYTNNYGVPFDPADPEERSLRVWRGDLKFNVGYNDADWAVSGIKLTADFSNYRHQELSDDVVGTTFRNRVNSVRGLFEQKKFGNLTGRFGFEGYSRYFSTVGDETLVDGPVKQKAFSVFGLQELKFERVTFQFGGRLETNRYNPDNNELRDRDFTGFSGAVGAKFDLWQGGLFVANYSHGYRPPALDELYNNGPHDGSLLFEVGNQNIGPETSNGLDLSLRHQNSRFKAEANFYYYGFKDFVFLAPRGTFDAGSGLEFADYLQADSRFTGTELSLDVTANKYVNVIAGVDYVNAQLKTGQPLPRIPPLRSRIGLDLHYKNLSVKPEFIAVARQDRIFTNETETAGYGTANITASYILPSKHSASIFSVNAYNLNNKLYYNHISFIKDISPEIGRGVRFSYTIRFF